ncbi:heme/hemin ABC transporter substrate-binding protein [Nocardioides marmotae]|uniref:heme/hemin ABC transporter substrate-binding protein n=1 Tax=Nocardioides marmotae TaxID=2663857 RepID=UPI0020A6AF31|nr:ABC transporter substrate-binding protein [Nocardioides marmotae]
MRAPVLSPRVLAPSLLALLLALLPGCGIATGERAAGAEGGATVRTAPPLSDVEPLEDVRGWEGEAVVAPRDELDPVATSPEQHLPVTLTDAQGTRVRVDDASRVLALDVHGTLARTVAELGLADVLVGRDVSTQVPGLDDLPLVTQDGHDLVAEAILELDPTLIITDTSLGPWDVILQLRDAGVPVVVLEPERTLDNVGDLIRDVAEALGVPEQGRALARRTQQQIDAVTEQVARVAPERTGEKLRVAFLYVRGQSGVYYMFGDGSGADSLIEAIGGYDVAEEIGWKGMKPLTDEGLVSAQPDLVLMMTGGLDSAGGVDGLLERLPALAQTPAGRNRRFVAMDDAAVLGFGPATASVIEALAVATYAPGELS